MVKEWWQKENFWPYFPTMCGTGRIRAGFARSLLFYAGRPGHAEADSSEDFCANKARTKITSALLTREWGGTCAKAALSDFGFDLGFSQVAAFRHTFETQKDRQVCVCVYVCVCVGRGVKMIFYFIIMMEASGGCRNSVPLVCRCHGNNTPMRGVASVKEVVGHCLHGD